MNLKTKILFIIPGGGDPYCMEYESVYSLIKNENEKSKAYDKIVLLSLPGHDSYNLRHKVKTVWSFKDSMEVLKSKIDNVYNENIEISLLARSGGCFVTLHYLLENAEKKFKKIILWGPSNYDAVLNNLLKDQDRMILIAKSKGLNYDKTLLSNWLPFESLISKYVYSNNVNLNTTFIGIGTEDSDSFTTEVNKERLKLISERKVKILYYEGLKHSVYEYNKEYLDLIIN